jgi:hypothetical protein
MRALSIVASCLAGAAAFTLAPATASRRSCADVGTTIEASSYARLYRSRGTVFACLRDGRRRLIGNYYEEDDSGPYIFRIAGRFVATDDRTCLHGLQCTAALEVRDLRTNQLLHSATVEKDANIVQDLVVTPSGSVAWIRSNSVTIQVLKMDAPGGPVVLDEGADVTFGSLARAGVTLYWLRADGPRSARLAG